MISRNPLPIPLEKLGVKDSQFTHKSKLHGAGHVNRVIFNAMTLCRGMGWGELMPEVWASAYLHDLSRRHDGECQEHGRWAVDEKLEQYRELFTAAGVTDFDAVELAVDWHCRDEIKPSNEKHARILALLKDADALDRCRLGDLDPRYLRLPRTPFLIKFAERLFHKTHSCSADWIRTWEIGVEQYNPNMGTIDIIRDYWDASESGPARRDRRLGQAEYSGEMTKFLDIVDRAMREAKATPRKMKFNVFTYCSQATLDNFKETGEWLDYWKLHDRGIKAWHDKYCDRPDDSKAFNDKRLYGEKGRGITYAIMAPAEMPGYDGGGPDTWARGTYGPVRIQWNEDVLESASFSLNDSQENIFVIPFSTTNLMWAVKSSQRLNFIEAQIHRPMKPTDIRRVT